jgi:diacylglycerol kinase
VNGSRRRAPSILESFNFAFEGIIHVLRTQRNMRIHFAIAVLVLVAALAVGVEKLELIVLMLAIAFVLITEMVNTAVEGAVDVARELAGIHARRRKARREAEGDPPSDAHRAGGGHAAGLPACTHHSLVALACGYSDRG